MSAVICTLSENSYHYGVAALVNSLYKSGFRGRVFCGYRGKLPTWAQGLQKIDARTDRYVAAEDLEIFFIRLETNRHFTNYKPRFMLDLISGPAADADQIYYFDPDIIVKCSWPTMETWAKGGIALCEDAYSGYSGYFPERHPIRIAWLNWLKGQQGIEYTTPRDRYYNAGFVGIQTSQKMFLKKWDQLIDLVCEEIHTDKQLKFETREHMFYIPDQSALNIALMCSENNINASGLEGMDYAPNGCLLSHASFTPKPWNGGFLWRVFQRKAPREAEKRYVQFMDRPIKVFGPVKRWWLKTSLKLARELARF